MPIDFSDEEKNLLLELARPIDQRQRTQFLTEVAAEIEAQKRAGEVGLAQDEVGRYPRSVVARAEVRWSVQPAGVGGGRDQFGDAERWRQLAAPVARRTSANFGRHAKTRLIHLTMEQLPPSPFTREQSVAASSLDRPTTCSR